MDPLDQKLDYKMSGLATATKKRHLDYTGLMVDDRQGGLVAQRLVRYQTLSTAVQKKNWVVWLAGHENTSATLSCPRSSRLKEKNRSPSRSLQHFKKNAITIPILPSCNHQISPLMGTAHPLLNVKEMAGSGATTPRIL